jgi:hypothetical protein
VRRQTAWYHLSSLSPCSCGKGRYCVEHCRSSRLVDESVRKGGNIPPETGPTPPVPPSLSPGLVGLLGPTLGRVYFVPNPRSWEHHHVAPASVNIDEVVDEIKVGQDETRIHHEDPLDHRRAGRRILRRKYSSRNRPHPSCSPSLTALDEMSYWVPTPNR